MDKINWLESYLVTKRFYGGDYGISAIEKEALWNNLLSFKDQINESHIDTIIKIFKNQGMKLEYKNCFNIFLNKKTRNVLLCCLEFLRIKDYVLKKKLQISNSFHAFDKIKEIKNPYFKLSLEYDNLTVLNPYLIRVAVVHALNYPSDYELDLFDVVSNEKFKKELINDFGQLKSPFQIILDEAIKQSNISVAGNDYESRIEDLLKHLNLRYKLNAHESKGSADQEHDLLIFYKNKTFGIGAKRTLRERYKQYNPKGVDIKIVFTIGQDLNEKKVRIITREYGQKIFLADEIYKNYEYLISNENIFSVNDFNLKLLDKFVDK